MAKLFKNAMKLEVNIQWGLVGHILAYSYNEKK